MRIANGPFWASLAVPGSGLLRIVVLLAALALLAGACSSDDESPPATTAPTGAAGGETPAATTPAGDTGATDPSGATGPTGSTGAPGAAPTPFTDPNALTALSSFRFNVAIQGTGNFLSGLGVPAIEGLEGEDQGLIASGAWIAPDQAQLEMTFAGLQFKQTIIGNQEWSSVAGVTTGPGPATSAPQDLILVSSFVDPNAVANREGFNCGATENVNGIDAIRCEANEETYQQFLEGFAAEGIQDIQQASVVLWLAQDQGYIVKMDVSATGRTTDGQDFSWTMNVNVTDVGNVAEIVP